MDKKTLVIERLNLISLSYYLINFWKFNEIIFISEIKIITAPWFWTRLLKIKSLRRMRYSDFPGIYLDIQKEATLYSNNRFYEIASNDNILIELIYKIKENPVVEMALQKILLIDYTVQRVKTFSFLKKTIDRSESKIIFVPIDNMDFSCFMSKYLRPEKNMYDVPPIISFANDLKDLVGKLSFILYATGLVGLLIIRKGFSFRFTKPNEYDIAFDTYGTGISFDSPYHDTFIYGNGVFNPKKILHVVRTSLKCDETKHFFTTNNYPYIEFKKVSMPIAYFGKRVLINYYLSALFTSLKCYSIKPQQVMFIKPTIAVINLIIENEIFYSKNHVNVFIARDEYGSTHIIRTMIANEYGCKTVGFDHGDISVITSSRSHLYCDYFCVWGKYSKDITHKKSLSYARKVGKHVRIIGAGIYGLDKTYENIEEHKSPKDYKNIVKSYKVITVFPTAYGPDLFITEAHTVAFYELVLNLIEKYDYIYIIFKHRKDSAGFINKIQSKELMFNKRICIDHTNWTYDLLPISDLIITLGRSSVGLEGLMMGKNVLYYNIDVVGPQHAYYKYDEHLVAFTEKEFYDNVDWFLDGNNLPDDVVDRITEDHGYKFDGRVVERLKNVILEALQANNR